MLFLRSRRCWLPLLVVVFFLSACVGPNPGPSYTVSGVVRDEDGDGIGEVAIAYEGHVRGVAPTSSNGQFTIDVLRGPTLITAAKEGWVFSGPQSVTEASSSVDFTGQQKTYALTIGKIGEGTVQEEILSSARSSTYPHGTTVKLTASAAKGWHFSHWEGDLSGRDNPAILSITDSSEITAVFVQGVTVTGTIGVSHHFPASVIAGQGKLPAVGTSSTHRQSTPITLAPAPSELIVGLDPSLSEAERMEIFRELRYEVIERITLLDAYLVRLEDDTLENGRLRALSHSGIHYVEPNRPVRALGAAYPNDPLFADQWHYPLIRLPQAWGVTKGSSEVRIAVIDTGVQDDHEELNPRLDRRYGYNFVDSSRDFDDDEGHGTHVTGTICALTNNGVGVAGVMWDATILPLKVLDSEGNGSVWVLAKAILYAAGLLDDPNFPRNPAPVDVINMSLGTDTSDPLMQEAIERVLSSTQIIMVAAAGNDSEPVMYPAAYPGVIAVGAVDYNEYGTPSIASYSNWGPEIDVVAPGGDSYAILSTSAGPAPYEKLTGTSMATPHVSGVVGLMLSHGVPANRVLEVLRLTSMPLRQSRFDFYSGYGLVNAYWAVNAVSTMRIIVGTRHGDLVDVVAETSILDPQGGDFVLAAVPPGDYHVFAWVDVQDGTDRIELGDYFAETGVIRIDSGHEYHVTGVITEVGPGEHDLDSPQRPQLESSSL